MAKVLLLLLAGHIVVMVVVEVDHVVHRRLDRDLLLRLALVVQAELGLAPALLTRHRHARARRRIHIVLVLLALLRERFAVDFIRVRVLPFLGNDGWRAARDVRVERIRLSRALGDAAAARDNTARV